MARDENQIFIFSNAELELIKHVFADNDELLYAVRSVFLQFPLTDREKEMIKTQITPPVIAVLRKRILPELSPEFPLSQLPSILTTLTEQLKVKDVEEMAPQIEAKAIEIAYLRQQFACLEHETDYDGGIRLEDLGKITSDWHKDFVGLTAYLFLLGYIDPMLSFIKSIAGQKGETLEQLTERMRRDSAK